MWNSAMFYFRHGSFAVLIVRYFIVILWFLVGYFRIFFAFLYIDTYSFASFVFFLFSCYAYANTPSQYPISLSVYSAFFRIPFGFPFGTRQRTAPKIEISIFIKKC